MCFFAFSIKSGWSKASLSYSHDLSRTIFISKHSKSVFDNSVDEMTLNKTRDFILIPGE